MHPRCPIAGPALTASTLYKPRDHLGSCSIRRDTLVTGEAGIKLLCNTGKQTTLAMTIVTRPHGALGQAGQCRPQATAPLCYLATFPLTGYVDDTDLKRPITLKGP